MDEFEVQKVNTLRNEEKEIDTGRVAKLQSIASQDFGNNNVNIHNIVAAQYGHVSEEDTDELDTSESMAEEEIAEIQKRKSKDPEMDSLRSPVPALVSPESQSKFSQKHIDNMEDAMTKEMEVLKSGKDVGTKERNANLFRHKSKYK